ncbi:hypothetical protein [Bradyrhizobium canariense]|uniref:hypothetical protein n=1 Tax=Bradyrhizobium canariense TaxID=255045 RepID=UPI0013748036|nr:hypothetical protein [Bradyrhizobium canariense]
MYSVGRAFRDRTRHGFKTGCDVAHPARRILKRGYIGPPRASRETEVVLQVLEFCLAPI